MAGLIFGASYLSQRNYVQLKKLIAAKWIRKEVIPMLKKLSDHFMMASFGLVAGIHLGPFLANGHRRASDPNVPAVAATAPWKADRVAVWLSSVGTH